MELGHTVNRGRLDDQEGGDMAPSQDRTGTAVLDVKSTANNSSMCSELIINGSSVVNRITK